MSGEYRPKPHLAIGYDSLITLLSIAKVGFRRLGQLRFLGTKSPVGAVVKEVRYGVRVGGLGLERSAAECAGRKESGRTAKVRAVAPAAVTEGFQRQLLAESRTTLGHGWELQQAWASIDKLKVEEVDVKAEVAGGSVGIVLAGGGH